MDSERPIEKLLRLAAKSRNEQRQDSFELHPVNRRLLQDEVARQFGSRTAGAGGLFAALKEFWPRLAVAAAILTMLCVITWVAVPHKPANETLAYKKEKTDRLAATAAPEKDRSAPEGTAGTQQKELSLNGAPAPDSPGALNEPAARVDRQLKLATPPPASPAPAATPAPTMRAESPRVALSSREEAGPVKDPAVEDRAGPAGALVGASALAPSQNRQFGMAASGGAQPSSAPAAGSGAANQLGATRAGRQSARALLSQPAPQSSAKSADTKMDASAFKRLAKSAPEATSVVASVGTVFQSLSGKAQQQFAQVRPSNAPIRLSRNAARPPTVLDSFSLQQSGPLLKVVDADGSVYAGSIRAQSVARAKATLQMRSPKASEAETLDKEKAAAALVEYAFTVVGTNRTLNERVEFSGTLQPQRNDAGAIQDQSAVKTGAQKPAGQAASTLPLSTSQISGTVKVGSRQEQLQALPTP